MAVDNTRRDDDLKKIFSIIKDLEAKSCELEENMFKNNTDLEMFKMNVQMNLWTISGLNERVKTLEEHDENHEDRIASLETQMKDVQNKMMFMQPGGGEGIDTNALEKLLSNYTSKDEFKDLLERVEKLEKDVKELDEKTDKNKKKIKKNKEKIKDHTEEIEKLKKKKVD